MSIVSRARRMRFVLCFYLSWVWFVGVSLILNFACAPFLLAPIQKRPAAKGRRVIRSLFKLWISWFRASGVLELEWVGFEDPLPQGTIYIANHPTLLDATFILSKLPDAICLMKASLMSNPAVAPAAILAGYVTLDRSIDSVRDAAAQVASGRSMLIFPEGTRTARGSLLGQVRPVFALIADRARAPVQLITIRASPDVAPKGRAWWRLPSELPARMTLTLDRRWEWQPGRAREELMAEVGARMAEVLGKKEP